ncbi:MAG: cysteine synthase family protein [Ruminococcus sp.]|nr:cysteine synthase family protein [Ruminococcus sp.]
MAKVYSSITELVGKTPLLEIKNFEAKHNLGAKILVKLEYYNPNQSVKDRIALAMIEDAEQKGLLKPGYTVVEVTSGNTGIGVTSIAAAKGYASRVYVQDNVSKERFQVLQAFGSKVIKLNDKPIIAQTLAETNNDIIAAINKLHDEVLSKEKNVYYVDQMQNPANPLAHETTTGPEIWADTDGNVDILVANVGTGGTVSGTGRYLKAKNSNIKIAAIQPGEKSIPSDDNPTPEEITGVHPFEGVPKELISKNMDLEVYDEKFDVEIIEAYRAAREIAKTDGILVGTSSGAAIHAAAQLAKRPENKGKTIVAILPDTGLRYLSTNLFNETYQG